MRDRFRSLARRALARAGVEVVRRGNQAPRRTLAEVLAHLKGLGLRPGTLVDVGVAWGTPELYDTFPDADLLLVEPLAEYEPALRELTERRRGRYVLAAAGPQPGEVEIGVHRVPTLSSVVGERAEETTRRAVPLVTLDELTASERPPFVLKVDVEGGELDVLGGAHDTLERTELVLLEVSLLELVPGSPLLSDVVAWMADAGWAAYDVYGGHLRPLDGALAQLDMAFVKRDGRFRADARYATAEQAEALYRGWGF